MSAPGRTCAIFAAVAAATGAYADMPVKQQPTLTTSESAGARRSDAGFLELALKGDARPFTAAVGHAPAGDWVDKPDEWFWTVMPSTELQRVHTIGNDPFRRPKLGCPVHDQAIYAVEAYYPWVVDCEALPYKVKCPLGGETYPSNDFAAGDLTSGDYADDGTGCVIEGTRYHFIGLYAHYAYNTVLQPAIKSFGNAYLATGDRRYAHKAAICLLKEAFEYPNATDRARRTYVQGYGRESGMITDVVWSSGALVASAQSYDHICQALDGDTELVAFAQRHIPGIAGVDDLKVYIEDRLFRPGIQAMIDKAIQPNTGWEAEAMATLALLLNDFGGKHPNSLDCLEWLYYGAGRLKTLGNQFYKDGSSYESTGYNDARGGIVAAGELLARLRELQPGRLDEQRFPDIRRSEKLRNFRAVYKPAIQGLGRWLICIGDVGSPSTSRQPSAGPPERPSEFLDGYGLGVLRSGTGADQRDAWLFYGGLRGHAHYDPLMLGLQGYGRELLPNIGYPQSWNYASAWEWSLATHNTVVVDRDEKPCSTVIGSLLTWYDGEGCRVMEASKRPYRKAEPRGEQGPEVRDYRRLVALIDVAADQWYAVDIFRVTGGRDHLQSWHGALTPKPLVVEGVALTPQGKGTLAGEGVEYGAKYTDDRGAERWDPYCHLRDVARGPMSGPAGVDFDYDTVDQVHMRLSFVPVGETELITARGGAPIAPEKDVLQWAFPHRSGPEGLRSQFVTVLEAYPGRRYLGAIRRLPAQSVGQAAYEPLALEISVPGGRDIVLANGDESDTLTGDGFTLTGKLGLVRERDGKVVALHLVAGTRLAFGEREVTSPSAASGRIVQVDRAASRIVVEGNLPDPGALNGRRLLIDNHGERLVSYTVRSAERLAADRVALVLDSSGNIGEGLAAGFEDGVIRNGPEVNMAFAGLCRIDGRLDYSDCFYYGGHLETGRPGVDYKVRGVMGFPYQAWGLLHQPGTNHVHLADAVPGDRLRETIGEGREWVIYEYGVGDEVRLDFGAAAL